MPFNSFQYAAFLAAVVGGYWMLPKRGRKYLLLIGSYFFYAWVDWRFCFILVGTTLVDFAMALLMDRTDDLFRRRLLLAVSLTSNLVTLSFFKYFHWFSVPVEKALGAMGFTEPHLALAVALPVGISFYTFSTLSYTIDVYRREIPATKSLLDFMVFISYFPHLLAGPIVRARRMLPQIENLPSRLDPVKFNEGLELILVGLFQKVAIADALAPQTALVFSQFGDGKGAVPSWASLWLATLAGVIQFTFDFAGYSNIARGSSKLLGLELPYNFRQPLTRSRNFRDFWRRDHMTMFAWFRDYLYRPLYRKRGSRLYNSLVLCFVFAMSGLWHDDGLVWLTWGFIMGGVLSLELYISQRADRRRRELMRRDKALAAAEGVDTEDYFVPIGGGGGGVHAPAHPTTATREVKPRTRWWPKVAPVYVFVMVAVQHAWVRTGSVTASLRLYGDLLTPNLGSVSANLVILFVYAVVALLLLDRREHLIERAEGKVDPMTTGRFAAYAVMVLLIIAFSGQAAPQFVYFNI